MTTIPIEKTFLSQGSLQFVDISTNTRPSCTSDTEAAF